MKADSSACIAPPPTTSSPRPIPSLAPQQKAAANVLTRGASFVLIGFLIATSNSLSRRGGRIRVINVSADILQLLQGMRLTQRLNASGRAA